jgi:hypothetical protein
MTASTCKRGFLFSTRNGQLVLGASTTSAVVIKGSKEFPVGMYIRYMSPMGHVLCVGTADETRQDECKLHPMDIKEFEESITHIDPILAAISVTSHLDVDAAKADAKRRLLRRHIKAKKPKAKKATKKRAKSR